MVDYNADRLEELRAEALKISRRIFHKEMRDWQRNKVAQVNRMLRDTLVEIGDMGERLSHIRDTLLVLQRAAPFVAEHGDGWLEDAVKARLKMAGSRHPVAERIRRPPHRQAAVPAGCRSGLHQHRAE